MGPAHRAHGPGREGGQRHGVTPGDGVYTPPMPLTPLLSLLLAAAPATAPAEQKPPERRPCYWYCAQWEEICDLNDTTGNLRCWRQCRRLEQDCGESESSSPRSPGPHPGKEQGEPGHQTGVRSGQGRQTPPGEHAPAAAGQDSPLTGTPDKESR